MEASIIEATRCLIADCGTGKDYDGDGNKKKWWHGNTERLFKEKAACLVQQYDKFTLPELPDIHVRTPLSHTLTHPHTHRVSPMGMNELERGECSGAQVRGQQTQSENIADNGGLKGAFLVRVACNTLLISFGLTFAHRVVFILAASPLLQAYQHWKLRNGEEPRLPGLNYTPDQIFYIRFGQVSVGLTSRMCPVFNLFYKYSVRVSNVLFAHLQIWCENTRAETLHIHVITKPHPPNRFR